jgi:hypothetical protein
MDVRSRDIRGWEKRVGARGTEIQLQGVERTGGAWIAAVTRPDARKHEPRACNKAQTKRRWSRNEVEVEVEVERRRREDEREAWTRIRNHADSAHRRLLPNRRARRGLAQVWAEA